MSPFKPVDWTVGRPASSLIIRGIEVSGRFPVEVTIPNAVFYRRDGKQITNYIVYDDNGRAIKRVDLTGKAHAGIPTPHVVEYRHHLSPDGNIFIKAEKLARPATVNEIL